MIHHLFAQVTAPSAEFLGMVVLVLILLTRWFWDYSKHKREEDGQHEPRANPPLHKEYVTREQHAELKKEVDKIDGERRTSVANLHTKLDAQTKELNTRIDTIPGRTIALLNETKQLHSQNKS